MKQPLFECHGTDRRRVTAMCIFSVVCVALGVMGVIVMLLDGGGFGWSDALMLLVMAVLVVYGVFGFSIVATSRKTYARLYDDHLEARNYRLNFRPGNGNPVGGDEINVPYRLIQRVSANKSVISLTIDGQVSQIPCPSEAVADQAATLIARHLRH